MIASHRRDAILCFSTPKKGMEAVLGTACVTQLPKVLQSESIHREGADLQPTKHQDELRVCRFPRGRRIAITNPDFL